MKKMGRRMVARLMAGVLAVSLGLVPEGTVRAEEVPLESVDEILTTDDVASEPGEETASDLGDDTADTLEEETDGVPKEEETGEPEDGTLEEDETDEESTEIENQGENGAEEETKEEDLQEGELASEDVEDIEVSNATSEAADDSDNTIRSPFGIYVSGVIDEEYGHISWAIDNIGQLVVIGTGDFAGPIGDAKYRHAPWHDYTFQSAEIDVKSMKNAAFMFAGCNRLESVDLRNFDTSQVTDMSYMFEGCESLTQLDLSCLDTSQVTDMNHMFWQCSSLTGDLGVNQLDTGNVTNMACMFVSCEKLTNLDMSQLDTSNVTNMRYMFGSCKKLTSLNMSQLNTGNVTDISGMFSDCSSLRSLDISNFDLANLKSGESFLEGCINLSTIYTPRNLIDVIELPCGTIEGEEWYLPDGSKIEYLPVNMSDSTVIQRNKIHEDDIANGKYENIEWVIDANGTLLVSGTGDFGPEQYDDSGDRVPWQDYSSVISSAEVDVTGMTDAAFMFAGCSNLTNVDLRRFDTSQMVNMSHMFSGCKRLKSLDVSRFNTSNVTDMDGMFSGCSGLTSLDVSQFSTSNVTDMVGMFSGCDGLIILNVSQFNTSNVTDMSNMFSGCSGLTSLDVSQFNTSNVTDMCDMFSGCSSLCNLDLSGFDTKHVADMSGMFSGCGSLTGLDLSSLDTGNVINMSGMFYGCNRLSSLDVSRFNTGSVTDMSKIFSGCGCRNLDMSNFDLAGLEADGLQGILEECFNLSTIETPRNLAERILLPCGERDSWYLSDGRKTDYLPMNMSESIVIYKNKIHPDDTAGGRYGSIEWFIDANDKLTVRGTGEFASEKYDDSEDRAPWQDYSSVIRSAEINVTGMTNASHMFYNCYSLESVDFSNFDFSHVTDMSSMFEECTSLTDLDLSSFDTSHVTDMGSMFKECTSLTDLDLSSFNTSQVTDMSSVFYGCYNLTKLNLNDFDTSKLTNMNSMFYGCSNLTDLDVSSFDTSQITSLYYVFYGCSSLTKLDLSGFDTSQMTSMMYTFQHCNSLTDLDLSSFDTSQVKWMYSMFKDCSSLTYLDLSSFDLSGLGDSEWWGDAEWEDYFGMCDCQDLDTIYTPRNILGKKIYVPGGTWYRSDGREIIYFPVQLDYSIIITKDKVPSIASSYIKVSKRKTAYKCGDHLDTSDLTVRYYGSDGKVIYVTDYNTNADQIDMSTPGTKSLMVTYNGLTATVELTVSGTSDAKERVEISGLNVQDSIYSGRAVAYDGTASVRTSAGTDVTDKVTLIYTYSGKMADGSSYPASDNAPANAGQYTLKVAVSVEDSNYTGSVEYPFAIRPASVVISVPDCIYVVGETQTVPDLYEFEITGLLNGDKLTKQPSFTFTDMSGKEISKGSIDLSREGSYYIVPAEADAGSNYEITYQKGILSVTEERVAYTVRFELNGHAGEISSITGVKAGSLIDAPENPIADGYIFKGWYKEPACRNMWDFAKDVVQEDIMLYACWITAVSSGTKGTDLCIQEIQDLLYTGSALKPGISVYSGDGETLLKSGKDYTIKYCNNVDADTAAEAVLGGTSATGQEGDNGFTKNLAYVLITGKGNYTGTVYQNFHINAVPISAEDREGGQTPAPGFTLKYTEQMTVNGSKAQKPFTSLRYKKAMKAGKDYEVMLRAVDACDERETVLEKGSIISRSDGAGTLPTIPKGYRGTFLMTVTGMGNYTGSIEKTIYVADKAYLMKNAAVTLGKNQKVIKNPTAVDLKKGITLTPAYYDVSDKKYYTVGEDGTVNKVAEPDGSNVFTVKSGKTYLVYGKDYTVNYEGNKAAGNAVMTLIGKGKYAGTKDIKFKIAGIPFNTRNIVVDSASFQPAMPYSGKALTQNKVVLYPKGGSAADALVYGVDYTISYKNNINKGIAAMTFSAKPDSGYSGSFKKTYKITGSELAELTSVLAKQSAEDNRVIYEDSGAVRLEKPVPYTREGVKPAGQLCLVNRETGAVLKEGRDYKVSYKNNSAVTAGKVIAADKKPVVVIVGKGSYTGTLSVYFEIGSGRIVPQDIAVSTMALNTKNSYQYTPKVKIMDGRKVLRSGADKDYVVTYRNHDQTNVTRYINGEADAKEPEAVISVPAVSSYHLTNAAGETVPEIRVPLKLYRQALKKSELYVIVDEPVYNGGQLKPQGDSVRVYLGNSNSVKAAYRSKEKQDAVLTALEGQYRLTRLTEGTDYILGYGANIAAGTNKGILTITGNSSQYGGSVTIKFTILRRDVYKSGQDQVRDSREKPCLYPAALGTVAFQ